MDLRIPNGLAASCRKTAERSAWLTQLPYVVRQLEERWSLRLDGVLSGEEASCSYVSAARLENGTPAVLKIGIPHMVGEQETPGLRFWCGDPTVRLLAADDDFNAMLLERCQPGTTLRALAECDQDVVISGLLRRLWRAPATPHSFRSLASLTERWTNQTLTQVELARCRTCPRRPAFVQRVVAPYNKTVPAGHRLARRERPSSGTRALAGH